MQYFKGNTETLNENQVKSQHLMSIFENFAIIFNKQLYEKVVLL